MSLSQYLRAIFFAALTLSSAASAEAQLRRRGGIGDRFYSNAGREHEVAFEGVYRTDIGSLAELRKLNQDQRADFEREYVLPTMDFLFGPLVHRGIGSPLRTRAIELNWNAVSVRNGRVEIPYVYRGLWIIDRRTAAQGRFELPIPLSIGSVTTPGWKECTDSDREHQTASFYWYFWDPSRSGCDHREGENYRTIEIRIGAATPNQTRTYPEYRRMLEDGRMTMTIAFGYVKDKSRPNPDRDSDYGMSEYRRFIAAFRNHWGRSLNETPIRQGEYQRAPDPNLVIGRQFVGRLNNIDVRVRIVTASGIDQMDLFAESFAHEHEDLFAWFGHSRVGSGFDARQFESMLRRQPDRYSVAMTYQIIYWGGCNSYSYYTTPFFEIKARASRGTDPNGSRNLDIIANGLPSYFALNAANALIMTRAFLGWEKKLSYQQIVDAIEDEAERRVQPVLTAVLGDEDNVP